jgi:hypothetical protein
LGLGRPSNTLLLYSRAVVAGGFDRAAFHIGSLPASRTTLLLPGPLRPKLSTAATTGAQRGLTISSPSHASPPAQRDGMTHLWPFCRMQRVSSRPHEGLPSSQQPPNSRLFIATSGRQSRRYPATPRLGTRSWRCCFFEIGHNWNNVGNAGRKTCLERRPFLPTAWACASRPTAHASEKAQG